MPKLKELDDITIEKVEKVRKELKVTQVFISKCLGLHESVYSSWKNDKGRIPDKYKEDIIDVLYTLKLMTKQQKLVPELSKSQMKSVKANMISTLEVVKDIANEQENYIQARVINTLVSEVQNVIEDEI